MEQQFSNSPATPKNESLGSRSFHKLTISSSPKLKKYGMDLLHLSFAKIHLADNSNKKIPPADTKSDKTRYQQEVLIYESNRDSKTDRRSGAGGYTQGDTQDDAHQGGRPVTDYIDTVGNILLRHARFSQTPRLVAVHSDEETLRNGGYSRRQKVKFWGSALRKVLPQYNKYCLLMKCPASVFTSSALLINPSERRSFYRPNILCLPSVIQN